MVIVFGKLAMFCLIEQQKIKKIKSVVSVIFISKSYSKPIAR